MELVSGIKNYLRRGTRLNFENNVNTIGYRRYEQGMYFAALERQRFPQRY